ncbi:helix-turn-helix transcriptional regulator [Pseudomonas brassicacearum]|nr:helix-turn-helix transcriptional regulator [Pseudomonas brassicacearum]
MESIIKSGTWIGHLGRGLARRELQFLLLVAQGFTAKQIARTHDVEPGTVVKRISNAMFKLGVHRQSAAIAEAMRREIIVGQADSPKPQGPVGESNDGVFIA